MIEVVRGDITSLHASAILRPVSAEWEPVSAVARRLEVVAGPQLAEQRLQLVQRGGRGVLHGRPLNTRKCGCSAITSSS